MINKIEKNMELYRKFLLKDYGISASQAKKIYLSISENERASVNETLNNVLQDFGKVV